VQLSVTGPVFSMWAARAAGRDPGCGQHDRGGQREEAEAGLQRGVALVLLHVVGEEQEHGEDRAAGDEHSQERTAARAVSDDVQWQQRLLGFSMRSMPVSYTK
jgi:hypothetical protein